MISTPACEIPTQRIEHIGLNFQYPYTPDAFRWLLRERRLAMSAPVVLPIIAELVRARKYLAGAGPLGSFYQLKP